MQGFIYPLIPDIIYMEEMISPYPRAQLKYSLLVL